MKRKLHFFLKNRLPLPVIISIVIGAIVGYIYYLKVSCTTNTCSITSNPFKMTGIGAIFGYLIGDIIFSRKKII